MPKSSQRLVELVDTGEELVFAPHKCLRFGGARFWEASTTPAVGEKSECFASRTLHAEGPRIEVLGCCRLGGESDCRHRCRRVVRRTRN